MPVTLRTRLRRIARRLRKAYGEPPAPRRLPPLDELVLTILSQNTNDTNRDRAYADLRRVLPDWEDVAGGVHISPWLAVVAILALGISWHMPAQSPEYLVAYGATHGRLYSHLQARKMAFAYEAIALAGLALSLPYWHVLGYL